MKHVLRFWLTSTVVVYLILGSHGSPTCLICFVPKIIVISLSFLNSTFFFILTVCSCSKYVSYEGEAAS